MNRDYNWQFMHLFERVGEPLAFGPRGPSNNLIYYNVPAARCEEDRHASSILKQGFSNLTLNEVSIQNPSSTPNLSTIGQACPKTALFSTFNPSHRQAVLQLRRILLDQRDLQSLLSMACTCRDSEMVNSKVWITAFASCLINRPDTREFRMPALWEVMPDMFFSPFCVKEAIRQGSLPEQDRAIIDVSSTPTGRDTNIENRLAYFREDLGVNSHHWHWHLIYTLEDPRGRRDRKGELFYWFHHELMARYDAERLGNGLSRVRALRPDDLVLKEGYFSKLTDSTSGQVWGTRQQDSQLRDVNRQDDTSLPPATRVIPLENMRRLRDRIMEAIDKGTYLAPDGQRRPLNIDILGDIVEASSLSPNPQYYGEWGLHNDGHLIIAFAHDPDFRHRENMGVMGDNVAAMRDPAFFRWHKYIDEIFDLHKQTLQPYNPTGGELQLAWEGIEVQRIQVQTESSRQGIPAPPPNVLRTFRMRSHADMSRGLDFLRWRENLGPVFARITHLNHDAFTYTIDVQNRGSARPATVRIYLAPRLNEHQERFPMVQQRLLFFELDRFTVQLNSGSNTITRRSTQSNVTIPWDQTFRQLERNVESPSAEQSVCGCGWPQHMLIPRGNPVGQLYDLVVFLTNGEEDRVTQTQQAPQRGNNCRDAMSYCGVLDQLYPDRKPMGYPFDRNPYTVPSASNPNGPQVPVATLEDYISRVPNMRTIQVRIAYDPDRIDDRGDGVRAGMRVVAGDPLLPTQMTNCGSSVATTTGGSSVATTTGGSSGPGTTTTTPARGSSGSVSPTRPTGGQTSVRPVSPPSSGRQSSKGWHSHGHHGGQESRPGVPPSRGRPKVTTKVISRERKPSSGSSSGSSREGSPRRGWWWG